MTQIYRFNHQKFADDLISAIERIGWDEFRCKAKTTDKVMLRAIKWANGTISAQTVAKYCNVMKKSPLLYFKDTGEGKRSEFYE